MIYIFKKQFFHLLNFDPKAQNGSLYKLLVNKYSLYLIKFVNFIISLEVETEHNPLPNIPTFCNNDFASQHSSIF